jgi:hypothetical protein
MAKEADRARRERLRAALRENLKRRKGQGTTDRTPRQEAGDPDEMAGGGHDRR